MSVVLRCPTCGTTQGHAGECEACSEGEVRYFCTNHDEGIWLDGPVCSRCGAKFGDAAEEAAGAAAAERADAASRRTRLPPAGAPRAPSLRRNRISADGRRGAPSRRSLRSPRCCRGRRRSGSCSRRSPRSAPAPARVTRSRRRRGRTAGGASSSRVPPRRVSRQDRGLGVPADRRRDHLSVSVVRRLHRRLSGDLTDGGQDRHLPGT